MMNNINIMLPEIFLSLSICCVLMIGVFIKKSFNLIFNLSSLIIIATITIILTNPNNEEKIFLDSFTRDAFSNYFKILILVSSLFVLNSSKIFIMDNKFYCKKCNYSTNKKSHWDKHLKTKKHIGQCFTFVSKKSQKVAEKKYTCNICNKEYKSRTTLWRHKKKLFFSKKN